MPRFDFVYKVGDHMFEIFWWVHIISLRVLGVGCTMCMVFFPQFCDVAKMAIIHKMI
jgi:hypothetical protein